jgi:hypothetical protein
MIFRRQKASRPATVQALPLPPAPMQATAPVLSAGAEVILGETIDAVHRIAELEAERDALAHALALLRRPSGT